MIVESAHERAIKVAVEAPIPGPLTYLWKYPQEPLPGTQVIAPLGKRRVKGVILGIDPSPSKDFALKMVEIKEDQDLPFSLPQSRLNWGKWLSDYYLHPLGQVLSQFFPPLKKTSNRKRKHQLSWEGPEQTPQAPPQLTPEQQNAVNLILKTSGFQTHLLLGVTGSGKTEVYLNVLARVLEQGKAGLVLVPEIALTPQLVERFSKRFPGQVAVIHSQLTEREKTDQWWSVVDEKRKILIGARSALFCPIPNLGLIVVDEEHEPSFKQEEKLRYHGRDAAVSLGSFCDCPVILGSATPSMESWENVKEGKYHLHELKSRATQSHMPEVHIVDLREVREKRRDEPSELPFWLSDALYEGIKSALQHSEQAALFLNRRGTAQMNQCPECGFVSECPNCAVSLTVHHRSDLVCHYCGYTEVQTKNCPSCHVGKLEPLGLGTERVETDLLKLFPQARIARADRDEIQSRHELEDLIQKMEKSEIDILVGTQMIAKGLDFPKLTCVGLVLADVGFHWPDFRATERSYQLLTQVTGRAGRHSQDPGQVFIQTYSPSHQSVQVAQSHQIQDFYDSELEERRSLNYPPFSRIALLKIQGNDKSKTLLCSQNLVRRAHHLKAAFEVFDCVQVLGPAPAPLSRLRGKYRFQVLLKAPRSQIVREFCRRLLSDEKWMLPGTKVQVDIDPLHML